MSVAPLVSVVTPFYNAAPWFAECIESVLAQDYAPFEYILVDNHSTDGSSEIAARYAAAHPERIRLVRPPEFLPQVPNYNFALAQISPESAYTKIVQADDAIFPGCLTRMAAEFARSERVGLVSAYDVKNGHVRGSRFPYERSPMEGKEAARLYFERGVYPFGSPTSVMYRSSIVRSAPSFFAEGRFHEDTEKCIEILKDWDFGFVPQVLAFIRTENESISAGFRAHHPNSIDRYIIVRRFAAEFFAGEALTRLLAHEKRAYYDVLAHAVLTRRPAAFWKHHRKGLAMMGESIDRVYLARRVFSQMAWAVTNPGATVSRIVRRRGSV
jgi:glycosyltransferase involved in cell wall biosynthesis